MARNKASKIEAGRSSELAEKPTPRSLSVATRGIRTAADFADMMSALMCDLVDGRVAPNVGNATCNAGGKLLRIVELQFKYGTANPGHPSKTLMLVMGDEGVESRH